MTTRQTAQTGWRYRHLIQRRDIEDVIEAIGITITDVAA
jgi:hypothetical protein